MPDSLRPYGLYSPPGSSAHGISEAKRLEWVANSFSRGPSWPRDWIRVSWVKSRFFTIWVTREDPVRGHTIPFCPQDASQELTAKISVTCWMGAEISADNKASKQPVKSCPGGGSCRMFLTPLLKPGPAMEGQVTRSLHLCVETSPWVIVKAASRERAEPRVSTTSLKKSHSEDSESCSLEQETRWRNKYLLSRMACSTDEVFSFEDKSTDCWLTADKNLRISFVLSVFPAPLSPLEDKMEMFILLVRKNKNKNQLGRSLSNMSTEQLLNCGKETQVPSYREERGPPLEKAMAPHSRTPAWKIPWTEEPGRLQSMGSLRVRHDWATSLSLPCIREGNGNPLQCSCLENPRDGGAWWAAVYGVTQSQTQLKRLSSRSRGSLLLPAVRPRCCQCTPLNRSLLFDWAQVIRRMVPFISLVAQLVKIAPAMRETWVRSLG